jgi:hypothetical protein
MKQRLFLGIAVLFLCALIATVAAPALSKSLLERPKPTPGVLADRVSMAMRGMPASASERAMLESGEATILTLADEYRKTAAFEDRMTHFWLEQLAIPSRLSLQDTKVTIPVTNAELTLRQAIDRPDGNHPFVKRMVYLNKPKAAGCSARLQVIPQLLNPPTQQQYQNTVASCANASLEPAAKKAACDNVIQFDARKRQFDRFKEVHHCPCGSEIEVNPYWNPTSKIKACPSVVKAIRISNAFLPGTHPVNELCGERLQNCQPFDPNHMAVASRFTEDVDMNPLPMPGGSYFADVAQGATEEPGRIVAAIVAERSDFRRVLTDTRTRLNGAMETFFLSPVGQFLLSQMPPNTFRSGPSRGWLINANAGLRKSFRWVERGPGHGGVMTTWAFHQFTNGYRAKANRVYEAFLCQRFVIPPGTVESNIDSDDLLVRQPCASCHQHIEPMGGFFAHWPKEGTNFSYRISEMNQEAKGKFLVGSTWREDKDTAGLGRVISGDPRFAECAAQRAFEFVMGRGPTEVEAAGTVQKAATLFAEGFDFMAALSTVLDSESFRGPTQ